jgi:hypothetical protein
MNDILSIRVSYAPLQQGYDENPLRFLMERTLGARWYSTKLYQGKVEFWLTEPLTDEQRAWLEDGKVKKAWLDFEVVK